MRNITITASDKLLAYMERKGYHCIAVEPISPKGCCADMTELHSRFVRDKDVPKLKAKNCGVFAAPFGEMLVLEKGLEIDNEVHFDLCEGHRRQRHPPVQLVREASKRDSPFWMPRKKEAPGIWMMPGASYYSGTMAPVSSSASSMEQACGRRGEQIPCRHAHSPA